MKATCNNSAQPAGRAKKVVTPTGGRKRPALTKLSDVRREMGAIFWEAREKRLLVADATKLGYLLSLVAKVIENGDLEERLEAIEKLLAEKG